MRPQRLGARVAARHAVAAGGLAWRAAPGCAAGQVAAALAGGTAPVALAWLTKAVLDRLAGGAAPLALLPVVAGLAAVGLVTAVLPHLDSYLTAELERRVALLTRERLYAAVNALPGLARLEEPAFQDRLQLAERASREGPGRLLVSALGTVRALLGGVGFLCTLVVVDPLTAVLVLAAAVPVLRVHLAMGREQAALLWRTGHAVRRELFYARLLSTPDAAKEVRLFGLGDFFRGRMLAELGAVHRQQRTLQRRQLRAHAGLALLAAVLAGAGLIWVGTRAARGLLTVGDVAVFAAAVAGTQAALAAGVQHAGAANHAVLLFDHYLGVVTAGPDVPVRDVPATTPALRQGIELRDVWFRYADDQDWVLRGTTLFLPYGATVALVGLNGAGKSTLIKLLCRFYDPTRGSIRWDGVDLRELDPAALRARVGAVFQDFAAYDLTAGENVAVGDLTALADPGRVVDAARRAGVHDTLAALPAGYDTLLTRVFFQGSADDPRAGVLLSGGQWQRVALARGALRDDRDLLILDEPSAGLDARAEHEAHTALRATRHRGVTLLVSHRLNTVRDADHIGVLDGGRITEWGTHRELMAAGGRYAELFRLQARGYADAGAPR